MVYANRGAIAFIAGVTYMTMVVESCTKASKVGLGKFCSNSILQCWFYVHNNSHYTHLFTSTAKQEMRQICLSSSV